MCATSGDTIKRAASGQPSSSAVRPASVIRTRTTSIMRPPARTVSPTIVASPARTRPESSSALNPWAAHSVSVTPRGSASDSTVARGVARNLGAMSRVAHPTCGGSAPRRQSQQFGGLDFQHRCELADDLKADPGRALLDLCSSTCGSPLPHRQGPLATAPWHGAAGADWQQRPDANPCAKRSRPVALLTYRFKPTKIKTLVERGVGTVPAVP